MKKLMLAIVSAIIIGLPATATPYFKIPGNSFFQTGIVSGKVTNPEGEALAGVTIQVKGSAQATSSANDGTFSIDVTSNATTLVFSYVGMQRQEMTINGQRLINVVLKPGTVDYADEVIVVGYTTQRRANLTGAVATVSGDVLTNRPAPNAANLIQGRVTGLRVTQPSAEPGRDNPNFMIRGRGTFQGGNDPLILIDGVTGSINNLSPDDIENITVLKDAASASIYGARAANGVILVTTKKGRKGQTIVSYTTNIARHSPTNLPNLITNSAEYMEMFNAAALRSTGVTFRYPVADIEKYRNPTDPNQYPSFNYIDHFFNPATVTNHNLSVSGGGDKSTFNLSLGYLNQNAMLPGYNFKRYNVLLNYSNQVSNAITVGTIMNVTYKNRQEPPFTSENLALAIYAAGPLYAPFLPDGSGRIASRAYLNEGRNRNPQEYYAMGWQNTKEYNVNAQAYIDVKLFKSLTWSSKAAINYVDEFYKMYQRPYQSYVLQQRDITGDYLPFTFGPDVPGVTDQYVKTITPTVYSTLNYETNISTDHHIRALAGYEQLYFMNQGLRGRRLTTVAPVLTDITGYTAAGEQLFFNHPRLPGNPGSSEWAMQSLFGRVNYSYKGKYLLEGNIRYDGTSKVSPDYRWGLFPSVSAGWVISEEDFFRNRFNWISNLKFRASYGILGNQDVGNYLYQDNLSINVFYPFGNTALSQGGVINTFRDQRSRWETTRVTDFGLDLNIRSGLIGVTFDWFKKYTHDILAPQPIPASLGLGMPTTNDGIMENTGIELELTHQHHIGQVNYGANFQISTAKNKVLQIRTPSKGNMIKDVGHPYDEHFLYVWDGIFQEEDINNPRVPRHVGNANPRAGDIKMKDVDNDGDVDPDDRVVVKGAYPDYLYSFGFNVDFKGISLSTFFQGVKGLKNRVTGWGVEPFHQHAAPSTKWRNAWTPQNRSNTIPALYIQQYPGIQNYTGSTYFLQDASYFRLKNIMLSYAFPRAIVSRIKLKDLSVYLSADNVFTITDYEGNDPERGSTTGNFAAYPQARILNLGFNVKL